MLLNICQYAERIEGYPFSILTASNEWLCCHSVVDRLLPLSNWLYFLPTLQTMSHWTWYWHNFSLSTWRRHGWMDKRCYDPTPVNIYPTLCDLHRFTTSKCMEGCMTWLHNTDPCILSAAADQWTAIHCCVAWSWYCMLAVCLMYHDNVSVSFSFILDGAAQQCSFVAKPQAAEQEGSVPFVYCLHLQVACMVKGACFVKNAMLEEMKLNNCHTWIFHNSSHSTVINLC